MLVEIVRSLAAYGPRRFYIMNEGITTLVTLGQAASILKQDGIVLSYSDDTMAKVRTGPILSPVKKENTTYSPSGIYGMQLWLPGKKAA